MNIFYFIDFFVYNYVYVLFVLLYVIATFCQTWDNLTINPNKSKKYISTTFARFGHKYFKWIFILLIIIGISIINTQLHTKPHFWVCFFCEYVHEHISSCQMKHLTVRPVVFTVRKLIHDVQIFFKYCQRFKTDHKKPHIIFSSKPHAQPLFPIKISPLLDSIHFC